MLAVSGLDVTLGGARVLRNVSFEVPSGRTVGLAGHNGAGKTTTLRAIMGVARSRGRILLDGNPIDRLPPAERARLGIGFAPEDRRLITALNVVENLRLPAEVSAFSAAEIARRLAAVRELLPELTALEQRPAGLLSGGQQKMAALGRALMIGDRLLLLDEPFQGLAPALARRYAEALRALRLRRPELAILITESNPALLLPLVDQLYTIERGEIGPAG
ncbi:MAG TPA: ATP-binding cassette domain-containing protein [Steroidobacteraceae bacterium]|nr:ATP-binding cassette domain-containing protein [Acetobacteraceae bacterium]HVC30550.1 ATP-binding cassette domain-containing protein [Steroidobacteraceae bacterium]